MANVTGALAPDVTCNYARHIMYNGRYSYRRADGAYFIWWDSTNSWWVISVLLGTPGVAYWTRQFHDMLGIYLPLGTATGDATVDSGTHL